MKDGGRAFPGGQVEVGGEQPWNEGMTLLDYFVAHAPTQQLWHFNVEMPTPRPEPMHYRGAARTDDEIVARMEEIERWDTEKRKRQAIQWPWVYAEAMLDEREGRTNAARTNT